MKKITLFFLTALLSFSVKAQELEILLLANGDANQLLQNYMAPVMNGMQYSLNNGWYHTAKTHKKLGFDITVGMNASIVPNASKSFLFSPSDYEYLSLESGSNTISTVMGDANNSKLGIRIPEANNYKVAEFTMPDGIGKDLPLNAVPSPVIQASIGIPLNTDLSIRFSPKVNTGDIQGNLIGIGLKHNLMQYFGPLDKLPLNVALLGGYTTMDVTYKLQNVNGLPGANQEAAFNLTTYTVQAIASIDLPVVSIYGGIGYDKGTSTLKMNGTYELSYDVKDNTDTVIGSITESVKDPINLNFETNSVRGTLGARLNLGFFKLFGDYTVKEYNTLTAGIAFSFR
jgi:hypothetical protein